MIEKFRYNKKKINEYLQYDVEMNMKFRGFDDKNKLDEFIEWKVIKTYRKFQLNQGTIWGRLYKKKLAKICKKTGIDFANNRTIGKGLIIGHWGRIVLNEDAIIGENVLLTHGVTIGRDVRGKRKGVPTIGDRVCIRTNSTVVGNVSIGNDVLIAPNTFVNFDVPDHSIVVGNPASIHHKDDATEGHIPESISLHKAMLLS